YLREIDADRGPAINSTANVNYSSCLLHDPVYRREPEPSAFSHAFRREEWLEDVRHHLRRNSGTGVSDRQDRVVAGDRAGMIETVRRIEDYASSFKTQATAVRHCISGIH